MKKRILAAISSTLILILSGDLQATELELYPQYNKGGSLADATRIAKGRIVCKNVHSGFHVWMNAKKAGEQPGHYIIKGQTNSQHEIRVRLSGDGWSPYVEKEGNGMVKTGNGEIAIFDILVDSDQNVVSDNYIFSLRGECL